MEHLVKNYYGFWTAESCRNTGLPMLTRDTYEPYKDKWLSKSRCKRIKAPVEEGEEPIAFYRVAKRGYAGLYDRSAQFKGEGEKNEE